MVRGWRWLEAGNVIRWVSTLIMQAAIQARSFQIWLYTVRQAEPAERSPIIYRGKEIKN